MYIIPGEGLLVADSDDDLPWSGPPGGSVRFIIKREGSLVAYSDDVLPLSGPPGGSVRYINPGEGPLVTHSDDDLCTVPLKWSARWLCQAYQSWRGWRIVMNNL